MKPELAVKEIFDLFDQYGAVDYLGEAVSKTEHSIQCGMLAMQEGYEDQVVVGSFLHDIGHLLGECHDSEKMVTNGVVLGAKDHDVVGAEYLHTLGFPDKVCDIVRGHVQAKRYLVFADKNYAGNLSEASKMTLVHQGGPMTSREAEDFKASPNFLHMIKMRHWDERGKNTHMDMIPIETFKEMCLSVLKQ
ncbi:hypothetical protein ScPMuIL_014937 [Solemya velum]